ncbi:MAG: hypothetical protein GY861_29085, partial [bacterium]|nr:hypothetical protein [bacterium]
SLNKRDFVYLGELLKQTWKEKKKSNEGITNRAIESLFAKAMGAGALGGKICGAGGGGYCWFLVDPKDRKEFIRQMGDNMDFSIDYNGLEVRNE